MNQRRSTPMRVAALYDIHGNLPALEAVLDEVRQAGVDLLVVGGDVLPGPMPVECLDALRHLEIPSAYIHGNGEREILAIRGGQEPATVPEQYRPVMEWVARQLRPDQAEWIARWPATLTADVDALGLVCFCHATPQSDTDIFTRLTPEEPLVSIFASASTPTVICGHTHMPFDRRIGDVRVLNPGSAGMPFGPAGAYWLLMGDEGVQFRRTAYDLRAAAARIRATTYPQADVFADKNVLSPPSDEEMLELFTRASRW
ncbi:MAG: metallophosphoesterase family protein [Acidobacteriota bacterium]|nr:metallophosphoesterase family protein [Acidobacteriota bacterium]